MSNFLDFEAWKSREEELIKIEEKYGQEYKRYRQVLCEILEKTKGLPRAERIKALCEGEGRWSAAVTRSSTKQHTCRQYGSQCFFHTLNLLFF